jgi:DnaJ-class molecular chaperone
MVNEEKIAYYPTKCLACGVEYNLYQPQEHECIKHKDKIDCPTCNGEGIVWAPIRPLRCPTCKGDKKIEKKEKNL